MDCPSCAQRIEPKRLPDGSSDYSCPKCGWGRGPARQASNNEPERPSAGRVAGLLLLAIVVVVGPYVALRVGIPIAFDNGSQAFADASDRLIGLINIHYWWIAALYIFLAAVFSPTYDRDNIGWFGGLVDNPFSFQDDWERQKRAWAFMLLPGKIVITAAAITWRFATAK